MKLRRILSAFLLICACFAWNISVGAISDSAPIKVGLNYGSSAAYSYTLSSSSGFQVGYYAGDSTFVPVYSLSEQSVNVSYSGGNYLVSNASGAQLCAVAQDNMALRSSGQISVAGKSYLGDMMCVVRSNGAVNLINVIDIQDYLKGVVPTEMSSSWPVEALKAQAVSARNYVLNNLGRHESEGFDICAAAHCQAYSGCSRMAENSNRAVDETDGVVATYNGQLAQLFYHASSGGSTENCENVWVASYPYLVAVPTPYETLTEANNGLWNYTVTSDELTSYLQSKGYSIGQVVDFYVSKRNPSGNVHTVTAVDASGKQVDISKESIIIKLSKYFKSFHFDITGGTVGAQAVYADLETAAPAQTMEQVAVDYYINGEVAQQPLQESYILSSDGVAQSGAQSYFVQSANGMEELAQGAQIPVETPTTTTPVTGGQTSTEVVPPSGGTYSTFTITGKGWGHNIGLSQQSAKGMADNGWTYQQILAHFFPGTTLEKIN